MITVFGSFNLDLYLEADTLPPQGQISVLARHRLYPGGKGANQAVTAARAGSAVQCFGCVGEDPLGELLLQRLIAERIDISGIARTTLPTGTGLIFIDGFLGHRVIYSRGANAAARASQLPAAALGAGKLLLLQGDLLMSENEAAAARARAAGGRVLLTIGPFSPVSRAALQASEYIIVNQHEAASLCRHFDAPSAAGEQFCRWAQAEFGCGAVITLSDRGSAAISPQGALYRVSALPVQLADSIGAGDAYAGYFAAGLAAGRPLEQTLWEAAVAAALTCRATGAQESLPRREEVLAIPASAVTVQRL